MSNNQQQKKTEHNPEPVVELRKRCVVTERDMDRRDRHILDYHVFVPEGTAIEDVANQDCWAHVAYKLAPMTQITVTEKTGRWVALLFVVSCTKLSAVTEVIWYKEISANSLVKGSDEFEVKWINHQDKFGVLRKSDKVWVAKGLATSTDAAVAMGNEMQAFRNR